MAKKQKNTFEEEKKSENNKNNYNPISQAFKNLNQGNEKKTDILNKENKDKKVEAIEITNKSKNDENVKNIIFKFINGKKVSIKTHLNITLNELFKKLADKLDSNLSEMNFVYKNLKLNIKDKRLVKDIVIPNAEIVITVFKKSNLISA